jgi:archaetidylinositol phosphate synthase
MDGWIILFAYALASNVAVSVLPHEPAVIAAGPALGVWATALIATLGTVAAAGVDLAVFAPALARRGHRARGLSARLLARFGKAPFAVLVLASLTPLPYWPFKALAFASGYPAGRYLAAVAAGRLPRYLLLAWLGQSLALPAWAVVAVSLSLTGLALLLPQTPSEPQPELREDDTMKDDLHTPAQRTTQSLTSAWEKAHLPELARRLPAWVTPDHLTGLGVFAAFMIGGGYVLAHLSPYWLLLSVAGLFVHWFGDSLDGTLARVRKMERERYGYYVDRTADAISTVIIGLGLGLSPWVHLSAAMLLTIGYLLLMLYAEICAYTSKKFPLSFGRMGPTEVRIALGLVTLGLVFWQPAPFPFLGATLTVVDVALVALSVGLFITFLSASLQEARLLDRQDRARWAQPLTSSGFTVSVERDDGEG